MKYFRFAPQYKIFLTLTTNYFLMQVARNGISSSWFCEEKKHRTNTWLCAKNEIIQCNTRKQKNTKLLLKFEQWHMLFPATIFVWIRKSLEKQVKNPCFMAANRMFFIQTVWWVFKDSGKTFRTAETDQLTLTKWASGFSKDHWLSICFLTDWGFTEESFPILTVLCRVKASQVVMASC